MYLTKCKKCQHLMIFGFDPALQDILQLNCPVCGETNIVAREG